jgi:hypothetical protein
MGTTIVSVTLDQLVADTGWLRRLAGSLVKDQAAAEDLVHDTVLVAAEQAPVRRSPAAAVVGPRAAQPGTDARTQRRAPQPARASGRGAGRGACDPR